MIYIAILLGIFFVLYLQRVLFQKIGLEDLGYVCFFSEEEVSEGSEVQVVEVVSNRRRIPIPWLKSELAVSPHLRFQGAASSATDRLQLVSGIFTLRPYHELRREWHVVCTRFGRQGISRALLVSTDLLGRLTLSTAIPVGVSMTVLPRPYMSEDVAWEYRQLFGELAVQRRFLPDPFWSAGVREYTGYEPLRDIHWYATARQNQLMVRDYQDSITQSVVVILNLEKHTVMDLFGSTMLDYYQAIRLAATCFDMTLKDGMPLEFIVNGRLLHNYQILPAEQQALDITGRYSRYSGDSFRASTTSNPYVQSAKTAYVPQAGESDPEDSSPAIDFAVDVPDAAAALAGGRNPDEDPRLQGRPSSYYRSARLSGREHVHHLLRVLAWLEPGAASPFAPLLQHLGRELQATDILMLTPYVDHEIIEFCTRMASKGSRIKLGLLARQNEDTFLSVIESRGVAELIPLYRLAGKLPDPVEVA